MTYPAWMSSCASSPISLWTMNFMGDGNWWYLIRGPTTTCCFLVRLYHSSQNAQPLAETFHHLYHSWHERGPCPHRLNFYELPALFYLGGSARYLAIFFLCSAWHLTLFFLDSAQVPAEAFVHMRPDHPLPSCFLSGQGINVVITLGCCCVMAKLNS